jgi:subtilisin family serine protease
MVNSKRVVLNLLVVVALLMAVVPVGAQPLQSIPRQAGGIASHFDGVKPTAIRAETGGPDTDLPAGIKADKNGKVKIVIELQDAPAAVVYSAQGTNGASKAETAARTQSQIQRIDRAQAELAVRLTALDSGVREIYRVQKAYNGVAVLIDAKAVAQIVNLPNVKAVHPLISKQLDLNISVPLVGAPQLWGSGVPITGKGIKVGIIDSGIDYQHADFGGGATGVTSTLYISNDTTIVGDVPGYPSVKVVGGWDFVGDDYDADPTASTYQPIPNPDPDPAACLTGGDSADHGTHVAGITAGYGVKLDGTTYTGTYSVFTSSMDLGNVFRIGPGVAPEADLYALRVFGCNGSTDVVPEAIDWAIDPNGDGDFSDHLDVINMSLGSSYGSLYDVDIDITNNAALAGVVVVTSAGNSYDNNYIVGAPSIADRALSVASSVSGGEVLDGFRVNNQVPGVYPGSESAAYDWLTTTLPLTGTLVYPLPGSNPAQDQRTGCYTFDITNTNIISGNFVLLDWTDPSCGGSVTRTGKAFAAHAQGVLIADNSTLFDLRITGSSVIPSLSIPNSVGNLLKANLPLSMTFSHAYHNSIALNDPSTADLLSSFSSRGPRRGDSALKPDLTAPGDSVFSAANGTGVEGLSLGGTSMAAPHVAGAMALLRQQYPAWTVEELKALAMNTAISQLRTDVPLTSTVYGPARIGVGRLNLPNALAARSVAYNAGTPGLVSVSFGAPEVLSTATLVRRIRVANKSDAAQSYTVAYSPTVNAPGVSYSVAPASVNVPVGGITTLVVTMTANAAAMRHTADPSLTPMAGRQSLGEASGYVYLTPGAATTPELAVSIYAAPRPVSKMKSAAGSLAFTSNLTASLPLTGTGIQTAAPFAKVPNITSLVSAFELQYSNSTPPASGEVGSSAILEHVGVTSDFAAAGTITDSEVFFGISTFGNWSTATGADTEFDIYIDTNRDGDADYVLWNSNTGTSSQPTDVFVTKLYNLADDTLTTEDYVNGVSGSYDTAIFNNSVMVLPVFAQSLGLTSTNNSRFDYWVVTFNRDLNGNQVDTSPALTYDAGNPGLDFTDGVTGVPVWQDTPGQTVPVVFGKLATYLANESKGVLLLHHHNATGNHAEVVTVNVRQIYLPLILR